MRNILAFFLGILSVCFVQELPIFDLRFLLPVIISLWFFLPRFRWLISFLFGAIWLLIAAQMVHSERLPEYLAGEVLQVTGQIDSLPKIQDKRSSFIFAIDKVWHKGQLLEHPSRVRLNWYSSRESLKAGDKWLLYIKLKPARGLANPGGFDYERWLFENRIGATGYVFNKGNHKKIAIAPWYSIDSWRQTLSDKLSDAYGESPHLSLVKALLIGDRSEVSAAQWEVLTATGTNHLLAISGLHIGLVALATFWIFTRLFKRSGRLLLYLPAYKMAAIMALFAATLYAALAGFAIPTQRALLMLSVVLVFMLLNRRLAPLRILSIAVFIVLLYDALAILSVSFWLSFFAVVVIIYSMQGRLKPSGLWWQWGRLQWAISLAMIPVLLFSFQVFSVVSPLANVIAVPWVSFIVVPLIFVAVFFCAIPPLFNFTLGLIDLSLDALWWLLAFFANLPLSQYHGTIEHDWAFIAAIVGILLLLSPRGLPLRLPGIILLSVVFFSSNDRLPVDAFKLHLLDVGQGLSAVIETQQYILVYDTGAKFGDSFDMGKAVVTPFLRSLGKSKIDVLLISHGDNDHIGGMQSLRSNFVIDTLLSGAMHKTAFDNAAQCFNQRWYWDGVLFEIIHPMKSAKYAGNNSSCVLKVSNNRYSVLLTGDIEAGAERNLLKSRPDVLDVDVLIAPHHGSNTSSTEAFISATSPEWILFPAGYRNRFGFPKQKVVSRYQQQGSQSLMTGNTGTIEFYFGQQAELQYSTFRQQSQRFWHSVNE